MISLVNLGDISDIFLTVGLIISLLFYEFGDDDLKKQFLPFIIVLIIIFAVIAFLNIYTQIK